MSEKVTQANDKAQGLTNPENKLETNLQTSGTIPLIHMIETQDLDLELIINLKIHKRSQITRNVNSIIHRNLLSGIGISYW